MDESKKTFKNRNKDHIGAMARRFALKDSAQAQLALQEYVLSQSNGHVFETSQAAAAQVLKEEPQPSHKARPNPAAQFIEYLDEQFDNYEDFMDSEISAVEAIAKRAEHRAKTLSYQVSILEEQLEMAVQEASATRKNAAFAKIIAFLSVTISIIAILAPLAYRFL